MTSKMTRDRITERAGEPFQRFIPLGFKLANLDAPWEFSEEPHVQRRQMILEKYPEIKKLMGYDPMITLYVGIEVFANIAIAYFLRDSPWKVIIPMAWIVSATINHSLGGAIHEIGHNLAFGHKRPLANRVLGMFANLPMAVPLSVTYKKYHSDHHRYMGHDVQDVDIPTEFESRMFRHWTTKFFWLAIHPVIHGIRPFVKNPIPILTLEIVNFFVQIGFDVLIYYFFGFKSLAYLFVGTMLGLGLHPLAGHFISEHYLFTKGQATSSYYGPLNFFIYNLGYHVEHHDFPYVPYHRLPEVRRIAAEFYDGLPYHTSWFRVLWDFIFRDDMGPHARGVGYLPMGMNEEDVEANTKASQEINSNGKKCS